MFLFVTYFATIISMDNRNSKLNKGGPLQDDPNNTKSENAWQSLTEENAWQNLAGEAAEKNPTFEERIRHVLSTDSIRDLVNYYREKDGKDYDGHEKSYYAVFTETEGPEERRTLTDYIQDIPNICNLGHAPNGIDTGQNGWSDWRCKKIRQAISNIDLRSTPVILDHDRDFVHLRFYGSHEFKDDALINKEISGRFFLGPNIAHLPKIIPKLIEKYVQNDVRLVAKFSKSSRRNDSMILYLDKASVPKQLEMVNSLVQDNPELFKDARRGRLWNPVDGAEKIFYNDETGGYQSPTEVRARMVQELSDCLFAIEENTGLDCLTNDDYVRSLFNLYCIKNGINPLSWGERLETTSENNELYSGAREAGDSLFLLFLSESDLDQEFEEFATAFKNSGYGDLEAIVRLKR